MDEKEKNTKEFNLVHMGDVDISTEKKPIIGTDGLATCIGVLLYNEQKKQAIVAHIQPEHFDTIHKTINLLDENQWHLDTIKYQIIPGYYKEHYNTKETLEEIFSVFTPFDTLEISENAIQTDEEVGCRFFAFDTRTGKFITEKVFFCENYNKINGTKKTK